MLTLPSGMVGGQEEGEGRIAQEEETLKVKTRERLD